MRHFYFIIIFLFQITISCTEESENIIHDPIIIEKDHFSFILYDDLSQNILESIQIKLDNNYYRVLNDLEVDSMNTVTVRIWNNESLFLEDMQTTMGISYPGASGWIHNAYDIKILYQANRTDQNIFHEFCHCVSLLVNPLIANNPRWLWEAAAIYESGEFIDPQTINYLVEGDFPTLEELNSDFNTGNHNIYQVGYLLSEFIIESWGQESFIELISLCKKTPNTALFSC